MDFNKSLTKQRLSEFVQFLNEMNEKVGFKMSSRGWCYILEASNIVTKDQFNKVESAINRCRKMGLISVDFTAEERARGFDHVYQKTEESIDEHIERCINVALISNELYDPDIFKGEEYYIQMIVEKIDLVTLFSPVCKNYYIPIANSKGWSSIMQRAEYAKRFKRAEKLGMKCVLLYCGDHDPDGLRISDVLRKNIEDVSNVRWSSGQSGYDPKNLIIERFGLNYDFIIDNNLTWIDNLITGNESKRMDLSDPSHRNHNLEYVQNYLRKVGPRKCEANSLVANPASGRKLCESAIIKYKGEHGRLRMKNKVLEGQKIVIDRMKEIGLIDDMNNAINKLDI